MSETENKYFRTCKKCQGSGKASRPKEGILGAIGGDKCHACNGLKIVFSEDGLQIAALFSELNSLPSFHIDSLQLMGEDEAEN